MDISVALCTFNGEDYLEEQLDSILKQTMLPDEIIIFDDNSSDGTWKIINDYANQYPGLIVLNQNDSNVGVSKNFERCIDVCSGDAIAVSDQDDIWEAQKLEKQAEMLTLDEPNLIHHNTEIVDEELNPKKGGWQSMGYKNTYILNMDNIFKHLINGFSIPGHTMLFNHKLKKQILPIPDCFVYDTYISIIASIVGEVKPIPERLVKWRNHEGTASKRPVSKPKQRAIQTIQSILYNQGYKIKNQRLKEVKVEVANMEADELNGDVDDILSIVKQNIKYYENRAIIYDNEEKTFQRIKCWLENIYNRRYFDIAGHHPAPLILKDIFACIIHLIDHG